MKYEIHHLAAEEKGEKIELKKKIRNTLHNIRLLFPLFPTHSFKSTYVHSLILRF